jgi:hypothetical protein
LDDQAFTRVLIAGQRSDGEKASPSAINAPEPFRLARPGLSGSPPALCAYRKQKRLLMEITSRHWKRTTRGFSIDLRKSMTLIRLWIEKLCGICDPMSLAKEIEQLAQNAFDQGDAQSAFVLTILAAAIKRGDSGDLASAIRAFTGQKTQEAILENLAVGSKKQRITFDGFSAN